MGDDEQRARDDSGGVGEDAEDIEQEECFGEKITSPAVDMLRVRRLLHIETGRLVGRSAGRSGPRIGNGAIGRRVLTETIRAMRDPMRLVE